MSEVPKMHCKKRDGKWWIDGVPGMDAVGVGPYDAKEGAAEDMRGIERFYLHFDERSFFTVENP